MKDKRLIYFNTIVMLCLGLVITAIGGGHPYPPGNVSDNIALNKSYTLSPVPNYSGCTDVADATQLTDGIYTSGGYSFDVGGAQCQIVGETFK